MSDMGLSFQDTARHFFTSTQYFFNASIFQELRIERQRRTTVSSVPQNAEQEAKSLFATEVRCRTSASDLKKLD